MASDPSGGGSGQRDDMNIGELAEDQLRHLTPIEELVEDLAEGREIWEYQIEEAVGHVKKTQDDATEILRRFEEKLGPVGDRPMTDGGTDSAGTTQPRCRGCGRFCGESPKYSGSTGSVLSRSCLHCGINVPDCAEETGTVYGCQKDATHRAAEEPGKREKLWCEKHAPEGAEPLPYVRDEFEGTQRVATGGSGEPEETGSERPSRCETDGCYRDPVRLLRLGIGEATLDGADDEETWRCLPCQTAMRKGNRVPGGNIEVVRRV